MSLLHFYDDIDLQDAEAVANHINTLIFASSEQQAYALQEMRDGLVFTVDDLALAFSVPKPTMERWLSGKTKMKPPHVKLLALMLMLRETEPELFLELFSVGYGDRRYKSS